MFTSFDENTFRQAIRDKDYLCLKVNTVSAILDDPTFERGEAEEVLKILEKEVPEIFEDYVELEYEERLEQNAWDKRYFTKLTYWFQENFAKSRIDYIREVGRVVHKDTARKYVESMSIQKKQAPVKSAREVGKNNESRNEKKPKVNFTIARAILAAGALVVVGLLLFKFLTK